MFYYIVLLFVVMPAVELWLLHALWDNTGLLPTVALVLASGFIGATLARMQGISAWRKIHQAMASGRTPGPELVDGVMILLAGAVLITPGIITDCLGFLFLLPQFRRRFGTWAVEQFKKRTLAKFTVHTTGTASGPQNPPDEPTIIDAEYTRVD